jgi:hypothetical protein
MIKTGYSWKANLKEITYLSKGSIPGVLDQESLDISPGGHHHTRQAEIIILQRLSKTLNWSVVRRPAVARRGDLLGSQRTSFRRSAVKRRDILRCSVPLYTDLPVPFWLVMIPASGQVLDSSYPIV